MGTRRTAKSFGAAIGERVRRQREALGLSQIEVARKIGMRPPKLCELEGGKNPRGPAPETLTRLAGALRVSVSDLLGA